MIAKGREYKKRHGRVKKTTFEQDVSRSEEKAKRPPCGEREEEEHHSNDDARGL